MINRLELCTCFHRRNQSSSVYHHVTRRWVARVAILVAVVSIRQLAHILNIMSLPSVQELKGIIVNILTRARDDDRLK